jgi:UDP-N-acetylglucosamine 2-epimerase (non-hydrolysing)
VKVALVAGARPNFMKVAPLWKALSTRPAITPMLVHTGQHHDEQLSGVFLRELGLPEPDAFLGAVSGSHAAQTASILTAFEAWLARERPDAVVVVGDVNSTLACALVAAKAGVLLAHVEAGLRSRDRSMPEEINRLATDAISDLLFATERAAVENLLAEGHDAASVHLVGNTMIDSLLAHRAHARHSPVLDGLGLPGHTHVVATLHRPANVDDPQRLAALLGVLGEIAREAPVVLPLHPRTRDRAAAAGLDDALRAPGLRVVQPMGYLDFLKLLSTARAVLTDSGGIQEETTVLGVPCLTMRDNTERPVTIEEGTNRLAGTDPDGIRKAWRELAGQAPRPAGIPDMWDGQAAERIAVVLERVLRLRRPQ